MPIWRNCTIIPVNRQQRCFSLQMQETDLNFLCACGVEAGFSGFRRASGVLRMTIDQNFIECLYQSFPLYNFLNTIEQMGTSALSHRFRNKKEVSWHSYIFSRYRLIFYHPLNFESRLIKFVYLFWYDRDTRRYTGFTKKKLINGLSD